MKIIIPAGGSGKRFWPISRVKFPKQFIKLKNNRSTLHLSIDRVQDTFGLHNIYISTNEKYVPLVKEQLPQIATSNILAEPARRDVGPAVGLALVRLRKQHVTEPVAILWADHFMKDVKQFQTKLQLGEKMIRKQEAKIVFVGETPTFATNNLGWIDIGKEETKDVFQFKGFVYRPSLKICQQKFKNKSALWNTGYFVSTIDYLLGLYKKYNPKLYKQLETIEQALDTPDESKAIADVYPKIEPVHFDHCVPYHVKEKEAKVIKANFGWDDPGTLYALKNYIKPGKDNATRGPVYNYQSEDCLVYNYERNKLVTTVCLKGMVVVNTKDALLVVHKDHVKDIGEMLKNDDFNQKDLAKYL